jgi:hypothetical protein
MPRIKELVSCRLLRITQIRMKDATRTSGMLKPACVGFMD